MTITITDNRSRNRGRELVKQAISDKKQRKEIIRKNCSAVASEIADSLCTKAKGRVVTHAAEFHVKNVMSNSDRRARGIPQDPALSDYQEEN
jgi:hypothetical protein